MKIYNIVLTGGPAAGKTTILKEIKKRFDTKDTKVIIVPETATELFDWNIPILLGDKAFKYQSNVYQKQKNNQQVANSLASELNYEKIIIIYDRAVLDNKAYMSEEDFVKMMHTYNDSELANLDFYDLVINLQTSANLDDKYDKETNPARSEDQETAKILGNKTLGAWLMHRNLYNVEATVNIDDKVELVNNIISGFINKKRINNSRYLIDSKVGRKLVEQFNAKLISDDEYFFRSPGYRKSSISVRNDGFSKSYIGKIITPFKDGEIINDERVLDDVYFTELLSSDSLIAQANKQVYRFIYANEVLEISFVNDLCFLRVLSHKNIKDIKLPYGLILEEELSSQNYYNLITKPGLSRKLL